jgi:hypothetical protein
VKTQPSEEDPDLTSVYDDRGRCLGQKFVWHDYHCVQIVSSVEHY